MLFRAVMKQRIPIVLAIVGFLAMGCGGGSAKKALTCAETLAPDYCTGGDCLMTWADVEARGCNALIGNVITRSSKPCQGFNWVSVSYVDTTRTYYYDASSGALVAVVDAGNGSEVARDRRRSLGRAARIRG
jgi:hypothetical protein